MQPGYYEVEFNAASLPSGVYFYQLRAGQYTKTKNGVDEVRGKTKIIILNKISEVI